MQNHQIEAIQLNDGHQPMGSTAANPSIGPKN
jgi:hypothetical protein